MNMCIYAIKPSFRIQLQLTEMNHCTEMPKQVYLPDLTKQLIAAHTIYICKPYVNI